MPHIDRMQTAIREERLDGWLFYNLAHRDALTDSLLSLGTGAVSTRPWLYLVPAEGTPVKIVPSLETHVLDSLPGTPRVYAGMESLKSTLSDFSGLRCAILSDPALPLLSTFPAAIRDMAVQCGIETTSASVLIQRVRGLLDAGGIASHEKAADILYAIVHEAWALVQDCFSSKKTVDEGTVQDFMLRRISGSGLITTSPPIVAAGPNSGNPHYEVPGPSEAGTKGTRGRRFEPGDVIQFDIWAKCPDGIFADISWAGYFGFEAPETVRESFSLVVRARDLVCESVRKALSEGRSPTGAELDRLARSFLLDHAPESALRHRTGHGIDTACHGSGVNLDSVEFPDTRLILEGSCFSVEPGLYFPDYGFRSEINVYISGGKAVVSGGETQTELLKLRDR